MNTQDPYRELSSLKNRKEYPGYEDFVPYRSDWRYGVGFFSVLMVAAIVYGYWKLEPQATQATVAAPVTKVAVKAVAPKATPTERQASVVEPAKQAKAVAPKPTAVASPKRTNDKVTTPLPEPQKQPEPMKTVTGPPGHR